MLACSGCLLVVGRHIYQKLLVISELVRQQTILYHADSEASLIASSTSARLLSGRLSAGKLVAMLSSEPRPQSLSTARDHLPRSPELRPLQRRRRPQCSSIGLTPPTPSLPGSNLCQPDLPNPRQSSFLSASWNPSKRPAFGTAEEPS